MLDIVSSGTRGAWHCQYRYQCWGTPDEIQVHCAKSPELSFLSLKPGVAQTLYGWWYKFAPHTDRKSASRFFCSTSFFSFIFSWSSLNLKWQVSDHLPFIWLCFTAIWHSWLTGCSSSCEHPDMMLLSKTLNWVSSYPVDCCGCCQVWHQAGRQVDICSAVFLRPHHRLLLLPSPPAPSQEPMGPTCILDSKGCVYQWFGNRRLKKTEYFSTLFCLTSVDLFHGVVGWLSKSEMFHLYERF